VPSAREAECEPISIRITTEASVEFRFGAPAPRAAYTLRPRGARRLALQLGEEFVRAFSSVSSSLAARARDQPGTGRSGEVRPGATPTRR